MVPRREGGEEAGKIEAPRNPKKAVPGEGGWRGALYPEKSNFGHFLTFSGILGDFFADPQKDSF